MYPLPPLLPLNNPKNQNFEKLKKIAGDIILHMCNKNHDHIFSFWAVFCPFTFLTAQKIKIKKKKKKKKKIKKKKKKKKMPGDIVILQ